jgi:DNA (cytosine-5)-methyltransferase 1
MSNLKVVELFAGVGGFRLGLEKSGHKTVWANQWEPKTKVQHAFNCYSNNFPDDNFISSNMDIDKVPMDDIPNHDLLVGGFPCQDYSVATVSSKGLKGKKGVLWWNIEKIIRYKKPSYVLLENVDRLIKSPKNQKGRDFGVMLSCLHNLGYCVEWRVIDSSTYGFPQRRKRIFIFAAKEGTDLYNNMMQNYRELDFLHNRGFFSEEFEVFNPENTLNLIGNIKYIQNTKKISDKFLYNFENAGFLYKDAISTIQVKPKFSGKSRALKDILIKNVDEKYFITNSDEINKWENLRNAKKKIVTRKDGETFVWSEGKMKFPDSIDLPSRTIVTSSGGKTPSRFKHIIMDPWKNKLRILTPEEVELLSGFPRGWTNNCNMPENWRYFCMGNALVVGLIEKMGKTLSNSL